MRAKKSNNSSNLSITDEVKKELSKKSTLEMYKKIKSQKISLFLPFKHLTPKYRNLLILSILCATVSGVTLPTFISLFGIIIKNLNMGDKINGLLLSLLIVGLFQFLLCIIACICMEVVTNCMLKVMKLKYLKNVFYQDGEFHDNNPGSKLVSDLEYYLDQVNIGVGIKFVTNFTYMVSFLGLYLWCLFKNIRLTLCITCIFPVIYFVGIICIKKGKKLKKSSLLYNNKSMSIIEEALVGIRTVASYCGEHIILKKFKSSENLYSKYILKANFMESIHVGAINGLILFSYAIGFWYGTRILIHDIDNQHKDGDFHGGSIISILLGVLISIFMLTIILPNLTEYLKAIEATIKLNEVIYRKPLIDHNPDGITLENIKKIEFKDVKFHYNTRKDVQIYKNLNFTMEEGKIYAFVGESGCGKSTILKLMERLYDPSEGDIVINGSCSLKDINLKWWRSNIGVVTQESLLFSNSIKNNIAYSLFSIKELEAMQRDNSSNITEKGINYAKIKKSTNILELKEKHKLINEENIINVSKKVLVHDFVSSLPDKYNTLIGSNASKLSGGQKQRISIARAVIRNPHILILDEATSSLDNKSEYLVQKTINNLEGKENRITIIIAHRLSTIRFANKIFVLSNRLSESVDNNDSGSCIIEQGSHESLMKNEGGLYYTMIHNQKIPSNLENIEQESDSDKNSNIINDENNENCSDKKDHLSDFENDNSTCISDNTGKKKDEKKHSRFFMRFFNKNKKKSNINYIYKEILAYKIDIIIICISIIIAGGLYPFFGLLYAKYVATLFDYNNLKHNSNKYSLFIIFISIGMFFSETIKNYYCNIIGERIEKTIKYRLFENVLHQEISFFDQDQNSPGVISSYINRDVHLLKTGLVNNFVIFSHFGVLLLSSMILSFYFCPIIAAALTGTYFLVTHAFVIKARLFNKKSSVNSYKSSTIVHSSEDEIFKDSSFLIQEAFYNMQTIINFGIEDYFCSLIEASIDYTNKDQKRSVIINSLLWGFSQSAQIFINVFAYWLGSILIRNDVIEVDNFMNSLFTFIFTGSYMGKLMALKGDSESARFCFEKYYPLIIRKSNIDVRDESGIRLNREQINGKIDIQNLKFRYFSRPNAPIYNNISFSCDIRKTTAIVGETGCGKSTIMGLLMRLYDLNNGHVIFKNNENEHNSIENTKKTDSDRQLNKNYIAFNNGGNILLDNISIYDYNLRDLRNAFSIVNQEPMLFNMSILENIKFGNEDAKLEDVYRVCKFAAIHEFIESLPDKYDTNAGPFGNRLSGGQKQRVVIARALLKNPKILLLDEATSSLDSNSEKLIENMIVDIKKKEDMTIVTIAHRIASIKKSDKIVVFANPDKNGSYVQSQGTHDELLLVKDGIYKNYIKLAK